MPSPLVDGVIGGLAAGAATGIGALGVYSLPSLSARGHDLLLSVAGGIMLAATFFALLAPAIEVAEVQAGTRAGAAAIVCAGLALGVFALWLAHRFVPHEHFVQGHEGPDAAQLQRIWLFVLAITLHNLPEGMAVGVGFASGEQASGLPLAIGIGPLLEVPLLEVTAQHPRTLLVHVDAPHAEVDAGVVTGRFAGAHHLARRRDDGGVVGDEVADHVDRRRHGRILLHLRHLHELRVAAGCGAAERADALGDLVDGERELGVLRLEQRVERREHRSSDVPVVAVGLQIEGVTVGEQLLEPRDDGLVVVDHGCCRCGRMSAAA
jgi:hypothetical protein